MVLPTGLSTFTPAEHVAYHNEIHAELDWLGLSTSLTVSSTGHVGHHDLLHTHIGSGLPDVSSGNTGHIAHHNTIHTFVNGYGSGAVGEALEPATTSGTEATTGTIASVLAAASPGDTILLRAGSYSGFTIPAGTSGNPITVKPYNAEAVTITSQFTLSSYTHLAGIKAESAAAQWLTRIGATSGSPITDVELRNSTIRGGTTEAIRVRQLATNIRLSGLDAEGGLTGHVVKWHYESVAANNPSGSMSNCRLRKRNIAGGGVFDYATTEDLLQIEGHNFVTAKYLTFGIMQATTSAEDGMDVKTGLGGSPGFTLSHALFEGPFGGEAMIIQSDNDLNTVQDSKIISDSLSVGASGTGDPTATLERLLFTGAGSMLQLRKSGDVPPRAHGVKVIDVVMTGGTLKFGTTTGGDQPHNVQLSGSSFTNVDIVKNTGTTFTVCTNNSYTNCTGVVPPC